MQYFIFSAITTSIFSYQYNIAKIVAVLVHILKTTIRNDSVLLFKSTPKKICIYAKLEENTIINKYACMYIKLQRKSVWGGREPLATIPSHKYCLESRNTLP